MIIEKFLEIADKKTLKNAFIFSKNNCLIYKKYQDVKDKNKKRAMLADDAISIIKLIKEKYNV